MGQMDGVVRKLNAFTGKTARQNKKLRTIEDWLETVLAFLSTYELSEGNQLTRLLERTGNAKFDLVGIIHNGRPMVNESRGLKSKDVTDVVMNMVEGAEAIRRYLIKPDLQEEHLTMAVEQLRNDYQKLRTAIDALDAEY